MNLDVGSGLALSFTIGQTSIGLSQIADSLNEKLDEILHSYSTIPGLIAGQRGSKYAPMIDFRLGLREVLILLIF